MRIDGCFSFFQLLHPDLIGGDHQRGEVLVSFSCYAIDGVLAESLGDVR